MMSTNEVPSGEARRAALANLLNALIPDQSPDACTSRPIYDNARLILGMPSEDLRRMGKARGLFGAHEVLFGAEPGRYFSCSSPDCAKIFAQNDPRLNGEEPVCPCGRPLRSFNKLDDLLLPGLEFNLVLDNGNMVQAFTSGRTIGTGRINDGLVGPGYATYDDFQSSLDEAACATCEYFDADTGKLMAPIYLGYCGGVLKDKKGDLRYLAAVCAPLLQSAARNAKGRFVCINHAGSWMHQIHLMLGLDVICTAGPLVYLGLKDVTQQLLVYQKLDPAALTNLFRLLVRLTH